MFIQTFWIVSSLTFAPKTWRGRLLTFHGVIEANFLMLYNIIFTAAFSSCEGASDVEHRDERGIGIALHL